MFSINRIVVLLTPVFSASAAVGSAWLLKHFPGLPTPSAAQLLGVEVTVATSALGVALSWLKGHQQWENTIAALAPTKYLEGTFKEIKKLDPKLQAEVEAIVNAEISKALGKIVTTQAPPASPQATASAGGASA
jgi:hypothetical protein